MSTIKRKGKMFKKGFVNLIKHGYYARCVGRYNVYPEYKLCYIDVPKTASTSIKRVMLEANNITENGDTHVVHNRYFATDYFNKDDYENVFAFVRNPFERIVSTYKNFYDPKKPNIAASTYFFGIMNKDKGFEKFVKDFVMRIPERLADDHFLSQYHMLYDNKGNCRATFIGHFENIDKDWKIIQEKVGLPDLPHYNVTKKVVWQDYYTDELADLVYKRYKKDIELFGYEDEYICLKNYIKNK